MKYFILITLLICISCGKGPEDAAPPVPPTEIIDVCAGSSRVLEIIEDLVICDSGFPTPETCAYEYSIIDDFEDLGEPEYYGFAENAVKKVEAFTYYKVGCHHYTITTINEIVVSVYDGLKDNL